jgi:hypothetical protein
MANFLGTWSANPESGTQFGYIRIGAGKLPRLDLRRTALRAFFLSGPAGPSPHILYQIFRREPRGAAAQRWALSRAEGRRRSSESLDPKCVARRPLPTEVTIATRSEHFGR